MALAEVVCGVADHVGNDCGEGGGDEEPGDVTVQHDVAQQQPVLPDIKEDAADKDEILLRKKSWKSNFPAFLRNKDRPTNRPTDGNEAS